MLRCVIADVSVLALALYTCIHLLVSVWRVLLVVALVIRHVTTVVKS